MVTAETFEAWAAQKAELEIQFPHLANPSPEFNKSQMYLSSIDELRDE
jgi:hypothetical protein